MTVERFFSDMDGTLLGSNGDIPQYNIDVIKNIETPFSLVSARAPMEMDFVINALHLEGPQIGFNRGIIYEGTGDDRKVIQQNYIQIDIVKNIIKNFSDNFPDVSLSLYDENHWFAEKIDRGIELEKSITGQNPTVINFGNLLKKAVNVFKIMIIVFDEDTMQKLIQYFDGKNEKSVIVQSPGEQYLEITNKDAIKANGIKYVLETENVNPVNTYAFGDGHNDIPMFELVGHPVAMGNAMDEIKNYAEFITSSNDEGGVGEFIKKMN